MCAAQRLRDRFRNAAGKERKNDSEPRLAKNVNKHVAAVLKREVCIINAFFYAPVSKDRGHIVLLLSVCLHKFNMKT